jgi:hypothetical protein
MTMSDEIEQSPTFTGYVLAISDGKGGVRLVNVSQEEYLRHRQLLPCTPRSAETKVISRWDVFKK